jgi:hypothetical protein
MNILFYITVMTAADARHLTHDTETFRAATIGANFLKEQATNRFYLIILHLL